MNKNTHFLAADVLRGVAILMVVVYHAFGLHYGYFLPWNGWYADFSAPPSKAFLWFYPISFGWAGVSLFFVLSGFCIHLSFLRMNPFSLRRFFWHRFWRIVPAYLVALFGFARLYRVHLRSLVFADHVLFLHNLRDSSLFAINPSFWSIATEVQLYCLFPFLLLLRRRYGMEGCLIATFMAEILWRAVSVMSWGLPEHLITPAFSSPLMTWFDWTLGVYVADRLSQSRTAFKRRHLWMVILVPLFILSAFYKPLTTFSFCLAAAISAVALDWMVWSKIQKTTFFSLLGFIGTVSYSIYLWHQPLLSSLFIRFSRHMNVPAAICCVAISLLTLAYISYRLLERGGIIAGAVLLPHARNWSHVVSGFFFKDEKPLIASLRSPPDETVPPE